MKRVYLLLALVVIVGVCGAAKPTDSRFPLDSYIVPVEQPEGKKWVLHPQSDEFDYTYEPKNELTTFGGKWQNYYHGRWSGPTPTVWQYDHVRVRGGFLEIHTSRPEGAKMMNVPAKGGTVQRQATYTGCITGVKQRVKYPAYIEAYAKIANSTMASNVWMLSPDDTQEIDIIEAYGADRDNGGYGADRIHISHHVFIRKPFTDYQPHDPGTWHKDGKGTIWREGFHRVGVYWRDPLHLEYYVDGVKVRTVSGLDIIDPKNHTTDANYPSMRGLYKELDMIINMEDQGWRAAKEPSLSPTNEELQSRDDQTFIVDWIRIYTLE